MSNFESARDAVFSPFGMWAGFAPAGFDVNFLGQKTDVSFCDGWADEWRTVDRSIQVGYPPLTEELFEWQIMLAAVLDAREHFTMIECGAGWGRWLIGAACAFRSLGRDIPLTLVGVEAEPTHFAWMLKHFRDNGINPHHHRLIRAAISDQDGEVLFMTGHPSAWYGQNIVGIEDYRMPGFDEARAARVASLSLNTLLAEFDRVDLMDFDIQGSERVAIPAAIDAMTRKVRRVFVETHAPDIHGLVFDAFRSCGWRCEAKHGFAGVAISEADMIYCEETAFGAIEFQAGVQCWINPAID